MDYEYLYSTTQKSKIEVNIDNGDDMVYYSDSVRNVGRRVESEIRRSCPVVDPVGVILNEIRSHTPSETTSFAMSLIEFIGE